MQFESRVVLDGSQTTYTVTKRTAKFESRVILDESQTLLTCRNIRLPFESRVTFVEAQAEANASACFFINSVCADSRAG